MSHSRAALPLATALVMLCAGQVAAQGQAANPQLPATTVTARSGPEPVEKSYRKMLGGMDLFEREHAAVAPGAALRFRLLPRHRGTDMRHVDVAVIGKTLDFPVAVAADNSFTLERSRKALDENAMVVSDRKRLSMTWRADIRTPGLPPGTRRLGDLRIECRVGMEAGLVSNQASLLDRIGAAFMETPSYCGKLDPQYLFFADAPLFSVALVSGTRREVMPVNRLYAGASSDPRLASQLPFCDCEVLVDRTYVLPLGDRSWPDDTLVEFEYIDSPAAHGVLDAVAPVVPGQSGKAEVAAVLGQAATVRLDSGHEVWVYQGRRPAPELEPAEFVVLFAPSGLVQKKRLRP